MDRTRTLGTAVGIIRAGVGGAMLVAPRWSGRVWVGPGADGPGSVVFARALGARDVALGVTTLAALGSSRDTTQMLRLGFLADVADAAATLAAARHLDPTRRIAMPLIAATVGVAGMTAARWASQADREAPPTLADEVRATTTVPDDVDVRAVEQARV